MDSRKKSTGKTRPSCLTLAWGNGRKQGGHQPESRQERLPNFSVALCLGACCSPKGRPTSRFSNPSPCWRDPRVARQAAALLPGTNSLSVPLQYGLRAGWSCFCRAPTHPPRVAQQSGGSSLLEGRLSLLSSPALCTEERKPGCLGVARSSGQGPLDFSGLSPRLENPSLPGKERS